MDVHSQQGVSLPTILFVDDEDTVRETASAFLGKAGYPVVQAASGEEALQLAEDLPNLRLIVTDIKMSGISGLELLDRVKARYPGLKFIVTSAYCPLPSVSVPCLQKPYPLRKLRDVVRAVLESSQL